MAAWLTVLWDLFVRHKHKMAGFESFEGQLQRKSSEFRLLLPFIRQRCSLARCVGRFVDAKFC